MASVARPLSAALACFAILYACGGRQKDSEESGEGREGERCYPNKTCDRGLECLSNRCVRLPDDGGAGGNTSEGGTSGRSQGGSSTGGTSGTGRGGSGNEAGEDSGGSSNGGVSGGGAGGLGGAGDAGTSGMGGDGGVGGSSGNANGGSSGGGAAGAGMGGFGGAGQGGAGQGGAGAGQGGAGQGGAGQGGAGQGGMGKAGAAGKAGGGGTGAVCTSVPSVAELFPASQPTGQQSGLTGNVNPAGAPAGSFDGYLIQTPCSDTSCDDCSNAGWVYGGISTPCAGPSNAVQNFMVGGTPGLRYRVTLHFYGIVEPKNYGNLVTRASGTMRSQNADTGATPPPWAYATGNPTYTQSDYNTWEIHVVDNNGAEVCSYFLNSDTTEGHWTYVLNYEKTIDVVGGGRIRMRAYDRNCRMIKNCYAGGSQGPCTAMGCQNKARTVDVSGAMPQPNGLVQPGLGNDDYNAGQWLYVDVTSVTCGPAPLACNGL